MADFLDNKYSKWYWKLIESARTTQRSGYVEKHHIIPRSLGGSNEEGNLVKLTAREHFVAHLLLTKMTFGASKKSMCFALGMMNVKTRNHERYQPSSIIYALSRQLASAAAKGRLPSEKCRLAVSARLKGKKISADHRHKVGNALRRKISFFAVNPDNEWIEGDDLRSFCESADLSFFTIVKRINSQYAITACKRRGWIFSRLPITDASKFRDESFAKASANRAKANSLPQ